MKLSSVVRGGFFGIATLVVEKGAAFALVVLLARLLPPESYGIYSFVVAWLTIFQVLADFGLEPVLVRRLSVPGADRAGILSAGLGLRLGLALASATLAVVLAPWASGEGTAIVPVVASGAAALLFLAQPGFRALLRAELRLGSVFLLASITATLSLLLVWLIAGGGGGLVEVLLGYAVAVWSGLVGAAVLVGRRLRFRPRLDPVAWRGLLAECWPVGLNLFVLMLGLRAAAVVLMQVEGPVAVGQYASAARLAEATNLLAEGAMLVVFPLLARLHQESAERVAPLASQVARGLAVLLCLVALVGGALASDLMSLIFGAEFAPAGPALAVLLWAAPLSAVGSLYANLVLVIGRQRVLLAVNAVVAAVLVALQVVLVPDFGILGAAAGVCIGSATGHVLLLAAPSTRRWIAPCVRAMAPVMALALASLMAVSAFADGIHAALWLMVVFPVVLVATGTFSARDLAELRALLAPADSAPAA